jgi:hypothetical protein
MALQIDREVLKMALDFLEGKDMSEIDSLQIPSHKIGEIGDSFPDKNEIEETLNSLAKKPKRKSYGLKDVVKVWQLSYDGFEAKCAICKTNVMKLEKRTTWHMSHVQANANEGSNDISNIRAICSECNLSMGDEHMVDYIKRKYPEDTEEILKQLKL